MAVCRTLNTPAEVDLADLLCELHPWADMARYTRAGGEAMAVAVRITRAATGRDRIAVCGYHGWSDWYVAANLSHDGALDGHLMPGLPPSGVPRGLQGTVSTFRYNQLDELEAIVAQGPALAAIVMEPIRFDQPGRWFPHRRAGHRTACGRRSGFRRDHRRLASCHRRLAPDARD